MENNEFKKLFGEIARDFGFERAYGCWFRESDECILALDLQRSNFSNLYYLNISVFVRGLFPERYGELKKSKDLVKKRVGDLFRREPKSFSPAFDLENELTSSERRSVIRSLFSDFLTGFTQKALTREGIQSLAASGEILLHEPVKDEIERLNRDSQRTAKHPKHLNSF